MDDQPTVSDVATEERLDRFSARIDPVMMVLALMWLPVLVIPLVTQLHGRVALTFAVIDYVIWAAFALEYLVKLRLAVNKWHFVGHHLLDLAMVAVPILRPLRFARLLRVIRLDRVVIVLIAGLKRARALLTHHGLQFVLLAVATIMFAAAGLELYFERHSTGPVAFHNFGDALWWAVVTVTTVGYGDKVPLTGAGKWVATVLMLTGISLLGAVNGHHLLLLRPRAALLRPGRHQGTADRATGAHRLPAHRAPAVVGPRRSGLVSPRSGLGPRA